jgi:iron complex outermembrane receptor protein
VIQIITKQPKADGRTHGSLFAEAGELGQHAESIALARSLGALALDAAASGGKTDNDRVHNEYVHHNVSAGAQWRFDGGRVGIRAESARQASQFPGSLTEAQYKANAHQSLTPQDGGTVHSERVTAFIEQRLGTLDVAAELSHREKNVKSVYVFVAGGVASASKAAYDSRQTQFSPRVRQLQQFDGMLNEVVAGVDLIDWQRVTTAAFSAADVQQKSKAVYLRDELKWNAAHDGRLAFGARHEVFDKDSVDKLGFDPARQSSSQSQNGWEAQGSYRVLPQVNAFVKTGQSYRVANADENGYRTSVAVLKVQTSHDIELGAAIGDDAAQATVRLFRHKLDNEIFYDPTGYGANVNLDPTRRQGIEVEARGRIDAAWSVSGHFQHVKADFTDGPNAGKQMALVPKNTLSARLSWVAGAHSAQLGAQWVDEQRFGDDFANSCSTRMPAYTTLDGRYARTYGRWELALAGLNLGDKKYYSNAYGCRAGIYPSDGRQLKLSARYDF